MMEEEIRNNEAKVDELIDNHMIWWDISKVRSLLPPPPTTEVLRCSLALTNMKTYRFGH